MSCARTAGLESPRCVRRAARVWAWSATEVLGSVGGLNLGCEDGGLGDLEVG